MTQFTFLLQIIFFLSIGAILHSYIFFPLLLKILFAIKGKNEKWHPSNGIYKVSILMSAFNEEAVIEEKLESLVNQKIPVSLIDIYIGSDNSKDRTNEIVENYAQKYPHLHFSPFYNRQGKPGVINQLYQKAIEKNGLEKHIIIITDASVMLTESVVPHLVKRFSNPEIGLVDTNMKHKGMQSEGISQSEDTYISGEVKIKYMEGKLWGTMMGPFGGCYAIRAEYFKQVPDNFLVDDFFIAMNVFDKGGKAVNELEAICYESVSHELKEEFRRKSRISAGNYQNLFTYFHLLSPLRGKLAFTFFSHKFLRWMGPFLIIMALVSSLVLMLLGNVIFAGFFGFLMILIIIIPIFDVVLQNVGIHLRLFRSVRYFFMMNLALLKGFFKYIKGIESNVWQPTKRTDSVEHDS